MHAFVAEKEGSKGLYIVMDEDPDFLDFVNHDIFDVKYEYFVSLEEVFKQFHTVMYNYDYGDD